MGRRGHPLGNSLALGRCLQPGSHRGSRRHCGNAERCRPKLRCICDGQRVDALYFHGNVETKSYDSTGLAANTNPTMDSEGGDIGTNGNMHIQGSVHVMKWAIRRRKALAVARRATSRPSRPPGVAIASTVRAETSGATRQNLCLVKLPRAVAYPPAGPAVTPNANTTITIGSGASGSITPAGTCAAFGLIARSAHSTRLRRPSRSTEVARRTSRCRTSSTNSGYSSIVQGTTRRRHKTSTSTASAAAAT